MITIMIYICVKYALKVKAWFTKFRGLYDRCVFFFYITAVKSCLFQIMYYARRVKIFFFFYNKRKKNIPGIVGLFINYSFLRNFKLNRRITIIYGFSLSEHVAKILLCAINNDRKTTGATSMPPPAIRAKKRCAKFKLTCGPVIM